MTKSFIYKKNGPWCKKNFFKHNECHWWPVETKHASCPYDTFPMDSCCERHFPAKCKQRGCGSQVRPLPKFTMCIFNVNLQTLLKELLSAGKYFYKSFCIFFCNLKFAHFYPCLSIVPINQTQADSPINIHKQHTNLVLVLVVLLPFCVLLCRRLKQA